MCQGAWRHCAEWALQANGVDRARFCGLLWQSLRDGRSEHAPVVVLMGRYGGEGKSLILSPLREIFGEEHVQASPQPGSFPLLGIETKKIAFLDEYTFDADVLPLGTQLLWFEGKSFPVTRPQNSAQYTGHLLYCGKAPIFVTCKEAELGPLIAKAQLAMASGRPSEETMLLRRMAVFPFTVPLPMPAGTKITSCGPCFARMVAEHASQWQPQQ